MLINIFTMGPGDLEHVYKACVKKLYWVTYMPLFKTLISLMNWNGDYRSHDRFLILHSIIEYWNTFVTPNQASESLVTQSKIILLATEPTSIAGRLEK